LINSDVLTAGITVLCEDGVEAGEAVGARVAHDVALAAQLGRAFGAREVLQVPGAALGFRALVRQDYLRPAHQQV